MKKVIFAVSILLILLPMVYAVGLSVAPAWIKEDNLARGQEYERMLTIYNPNKNEETFSLTAINISDWISFYPFENPTQQITQIAIPPESSARVLVKFKIPDGTPSGNYTSTIYVQGAAQTTGEGTSGVAIRIPVKVFLEVTGEQILKGEVKGITVADTEINHLLTIKVDFQNTGNVIATPRIEVAISKNGIEVANLLHDNTNVKVGNTNTINVEWDTTGQTVGNYTANVKVYLGELLSEKNLNFKILERGTLTAKGNILNVSVPKEIDLEQVTKIDVQFQNTGEIDIMAKISGEVYLNDQLVDTISSDEVLVKVGKTETLTSYYKPEKSGEYLIKANVLYEGKTITMDPISVSVKSSSPLTGFSVLPVLTNPIVWGSILAAIVLIIIAVFIKKWRYSVWRIPGATMYINFSTIFS